MGKLIRKNSKKQVVSYENSIKKSNKLSMARLNQGLTLNQMQLLAYAIFSTQQDGKTQFIKAEFEKKFGLNEYRTGHAKGDAQRLLDLKFSIEDLENDYFEYWNVFQSIRYDKGSFRFKWTDDMIPHILELKDKYVTLDLAVTVHFKSGFTWTLYDYLKAHYGYWHKEVSKDALMKMFGVENKKTYQKNTGDLKRTVLDVAVAELNKYTELEVWYTEVRIGRAITGFVLHWSTGDRVASATDGQMAYLKELHDVVQADMGIYFSFEDSDNVMKAREHIIALNEIDNLASRGMTHEEADKAIVKAKSHLIGLGKLREREESGVITVPFYNWLVERD